MAIAVLIFATAYAAFCVWLIVRMINRRERSAKLAFAAVFLLSALYFGSFGPACWISSRVEPSGEAVSLIYRPVVWPAKKVSGTFLSVLHPPG